MFGHITRKNLKNVKAKKLTYIINVDLEPIDWTLNYGSEKSIIFMNVFKSWLRKTLLKCFSPKDCFYRTPLMKQGLFSSPNMDTVWWFRENCVF